MEEDEHMEYHRKSAEGWKAHVERLRKNDVVGDDFRFTCALNPGDILVTRRQGSKGMDSSYASVALVVHGESRAVFLSADSARRLAATLLDIADEIAPYVKGTAADDLMGGER